MEINIKKAKNLAGKIHTLEKVRDSLIKTEKSLKPTINKKYYNSLRWFVEGRIRATKREIDGYKRRYQATAKRKYSGNEKIC